MKKTHLLLMVVLMIAICLTQQANGKIWRVNNSSNYNGSTLWGDNLGGTPSYPVFPQINDALAAGSGTLVAGGDTLYVEPSPILYNPAAVNRKIIIIGSGYFLSQNPHVSSTTDSSLIGEIEFNVGSEGSQLIAMSQKSSGSFPWFFINVNNITIKRCNLVNSIQIGSNLIDVYILQNFFSSSGDATMLRANGDFYVYPTDLIFNNNICKKTLIWGGSILQCDNNTFDGPANALNLQFTTSEFKNNILKSLNATTNINNGNDLNVTYNIGTSTTQFGTANNNIIVPAISSIFVTSSSPDGMYQVVPNSVAANSGSDGTDRGAFGGGAIADHYTLSGLAPIPVIYSISIAGATATDLPVTIGARTIK